MNINKLTAYLNY